MVTLYEILEVSENASDEVIEKAYKVLAKRYHPDLQNVKDKVYAEEKMKEINKAYEILTDTKKRQEYDNELKRIRDREIYIKEQEFLKRAINENKIKEEQNTKDDSSYNMQEHNRYKKYSYKEQQKEEIRNQRDYIRKYMRYLRKMKAEMTIEKIRDFCITILIMIGIVCLLWIIPPTHNMIVDFYENNIIIKTIVDTINNGIKNIKLGLYK